jgi:hypothetical protein
MSPALKNSAGSKIDGVAANADVHQLLELLELLAYCVAAGLPRRVLVSVGKQRERSGPYDCSFRHGDSMTVNLALSEARAVTDMAGVRARVVEQLSAAASNSTSGTSPERVRIGAREERERNDRERPVAARPGALYRKLQRLCPR